MTKLSTPSFLPRELHVKFRHIFSSRARTGQISASEVVLFNALMNRPLNSGFSSVTNQNKVANNRQPHGTFIAAVRQATLAVKHELYKKTYGEWTIKHAAELETLIGQKFTAWKDA